MTVEIFGSAELEGKRKPLHSFFSNNYRIRKGLTDCSELIEIDTLKSTLDSSVRSMGPLTPPVKNVTTDP